nr:hypothetical protein K-LCC10_0058 [Kaumoebavirus]
MQHVPLEIHLEIIRTLSLREFKAYRRLCKSSSEIPMTEYRRLKPAETDLRVLRHGTIREYFDLLDEHSVNFKITNIMHKIIEICRVRKLWDAIFSFGDVITLTMNGKKILFELTTDKEKIKKIRFDNHTLYLRWVGIVNCKDRAVKEFVMDVLKVE